MKKFLINLRKSEAFPLFLAMLVMSMAGTTCFAMTSKARSASEAHEVVKNGNTFEVVKTSSQDVQTYLNWKDKDGIVYPIYITKKGACYVKRISKKIGKEYKYYLPKEVQEQDERS